MDESRKDARRIRNVVDDMDRTDVRRNLIQ